MNANMAMSRKGQLMEMHVNRALMIMNVTLVGYVLTVDRQIVTEITMSQIMLYATQLVINVKMRRYRRTPRVLNVVTFAKSVRF